MLNQSIGFSGFVSEKMMQRVVILSLLLLIVLGVFSRAGAEDVQAIIAMLDKQIEDAQTDEERAKLTCYKARNHLNNNDLQQAEQDYLEALDFAFTGWIINEYSRFLYRSGEFERAYRAAARVAEEFPQFEKEAKAMMTKAKLRYQEEYNQAHPPTIIMNTEVDPNRVTRHDLIRKAAARNQSVMGNRKQVSKLPPVTARSKTIKTKRS